MGHPAAQIVSFLRAGGRAQAEVDRIIGNKISQTIDAARPTPAAAGGGMNKWEWEYRDRLELSMLDPRGVQWYAFEGIKLRLAKRTWYTPDFAVIAGDGGLGFHEVKGFWRDDARVKIKVAAEMYPHFRFYVCQKLKAPGNTGGTGGISGGWKIEQVTP